jgi:DNA-binding response OmpR family regulator
MYHAKGRLMSNMQLFEAMPQEQRPKVDDDRSTKLLDVQICNARKRLGADGILTTWGKGRALSAAGMARVAAILQPNMEQAA